jgi:hypothetical protein
MPDYTVILRSVRSNQRQEMRITADRLLEKGIVKGHEDIGIHRDPSGPTTHTSIHVNENYIIRVGNIDSLSRGVEIAEAVMDSGVNVTAGSLHF